METCENSNDYTQIQINYVPFFISNLLNIYTKMYTKWIFNIESAKKKPGWLSDYTCVESVSAIENEYFFLSFVKNVENVKIEGVECFQDEASNYSSKWLNEMWN